jgi:hypothetical protein
LLKKALLNIIYTKPLTKKIEVFLIWFKGLKYMYQVFLWFNDLQVADRLIVDYVSWCR